MLRVCEAKAASIRVVITLQTDALQMSDKENLVGLLCCGGHCAEFIFIL